MKSCKNKTSDMTDSRKLRGRGIKVPFVEESIGTSNENMCNESVHSTQKNGINAYGSSTDNKSSTLNIKVERKRGKIMNEDDYLMDIRAQPGSALPVIKYMQHKLQSNDVDAPKHIFDMYFLVLEGEEQKNLCIAYINYLVFTKKDYVAETKRLYKVCGVNLLQVISHNTNNLELTSLWYKVSASKRALRHLLKLMFESGKDQAMQFIESHEKHCDVRIEALYMYADHPRARAEKILDNSKEAWNAYLKSEHGNYKRALFRRVVDKKWRLRDMKDFYSMWLEFEKAINGNTEEVRSRATDFVSTLKTK